MDKAGISDMHYIRFLKPPRPLPSSPQTLSAKITVTTDLGESFLRVDVWLVVELLGTNSSYTTKVREYLWKGNDGMRSLEVSVAIPIGHKEYNHPTVRMLVRPKVSEYAVDTFVSALAVDKASRYDNTAGIVAVRSMEIATGPLQTAKTGMAERVFSAKGKDMHIWEETGESIARHIWYDLIQTGTSSLSFTANKMIGTPA